jgi:hypothetical protein
MYTITPVYSKSVRKQIQNRPDYLLKIFTRDEKIVKIFYVERYIDALRLVQRLQMHLKQSDKLFAA